MKLRINPFLRHTLVLTTLLALGATTAHAATYNWQGTNSTIFNDGASWVSGTWDQWSDYTFNSAVTNGTSTIDGYFGIGSLSLQSGLTHDITIGTTGNPFIMGTDQSSSQGLISIAADSRDLTINSEYIASTAVTWDVGAGRTLTLNGALNNWYAPASLVKNGAGTAVLAQMGNYTGGTTVNDGTLILANGDWVTGAFFNGNGATGTITVGSGATLSTSNGVTQIKNGLTLNGGTVSSRGNYYGTGNGSWGNLLLSSNITAGNSATSLISSEIRLDADRSITVGSGSALNISGGIAISPLGGSYGLTKTGTGTLTLSGSNSYNGGTTINGGTLTALRSTIGTGAVVINNGGTLYAADQWVLCGANPYGVNERNIGTLTINAGGTLQLDATNGFVNGATNLYLNGGLVTGGPNNFRGDLYLYNGNEQITAGGATSSTIASVIGVTGNNNTITVDSGSTLNITGLVKNSDWFGNGVTPGGMIKAGAGTLTLSAANSYTGTTEIQGGTLLAANNTALGAGGWSGSTLTNIRDGATLALQGSISLDEHMHPTGSGVGGLGAIRSLSGNNALTMTNGNSGSGPGFGLDGNTTIGVDADTLTVTGFYHDSGSYGITKVGNGTLVLSQYNSYTGATTVSGGTLVLQNSYASSGFAISTGATLELNVTSGQRDLWTTTFSGTGTLTKTGAGGVIWGPGIATFAMGAGSLIDVQQGSFTGGSYANENWTGNLSALNVASGATFSGVEANVRVDALTGAGTITSGYGGAGYVNFTFGVNDGSGIFTGSLTDGAAAGNFVKAGSGTQTLSGTNSYTGSTTVLAGTLSLGNGISNSNLADGADVTVESGAMLNLNFGNTDTVDELWLGGVRKSPGVYGAGNSGGLITGTGTLTVTHGPSADPYLAWIDATWPTLSDKTPTGDPDNDGISNLVEYVLQDGDPSVSTTDTLPTVDASGADFVFTFFRRNASAADTTQSFQYSTTLADGSWTTLAIPGGASVVVTDQGGGIDKVEITIAKGIQPTLFGRLKVAK